jgi:thiol-disulfide isomerase/thioredoxin
MLHTGLTLLLMLLSGPVVLRSQTAGENLPVVRRIAPADIDSLLRRQKGNVVLLNIWASWCKPCMEEMPDLLRLRREFHDKPFTLLLISDDDAENVDNLVRPALRKFGVTFPTYNLGGSNDEAVINAVDSTWSGALPASFIFAPNGILSVRLVGGKTKAAFEKELRKFFQ